jgi:alkyldihydroxyacetonephosphate synthase
MRRWNGWGETDVAYPLPPAAANYLENKIGLLSISADKPLADVLGVVPRSRLTDHPLIDVNAETRLRHACGQSLPDWIALRFGRIHAYPDGVATPNSDEEVRDLISFAVRTGANLIPYGGGTSVVGHINPVGGDEPVLTVDLGRLNRLLSLDKTSQLATFQAGVCGPELERGLQGQGYTLGHFPQSFEYSTLGGWIATRSCGQQSYFYGRIEDLFAGGQIETPRGLLSLPSYPASAAGPDLRQMALGSEGRMGIITQAVVRVTPVPEAEEFHGVFFRSWESGVEAVRRAVQADLPVSMLRLSDPIETKTTLLLSGRERLTEWGNRGLTALGYGPARCLLIYGLTGSRRLVSATRGQAGRIWRSYQGLSVGKFVGEAWRKSRFRSPYLRNTLWERGVALDTLETALPWASVLPGVKVIKEVVERTGKVAGADPLVFSHLSHVYRTGASVYVTILFRRGVDPDLLLHRWQQMKQAASVAILQLGGTITHQHGIGKDHMPYMDGEKSTMGMEIIQGVCRGVDPEGIMNPGKLWRTIG